MGLSTEARGRSETRNQKTHPSTTIDKCEHLPLTWISNSYSGKEMNPTFSSFLFECSFPTPFVRRPSVHVFFIPLHCFCYQLVHTPFLLIFFFTFHLPLRRFFVCLLRTTCRSDNLFFFLPAHVFCHPLTLRTERSPLCLTVCYPSLSILIRRHISLFFPFPSTPCLDRRYAIWDTFLGTHIHTTPTLLLCLFDIYFISLSLSARRFSTTILSL